MMKTEDAVKSKVIVRVTTSRINGRNGGAKFVREIYTQKRRSEGFDFWSHEVSMGAHEAIGKIVNLYSVQDGIYEMVLINFSTDWETGLVDDYQFQLNPTNALRN